MGDQSEAVYFDVKPLGATTRWGFRRPEGVSVGKFPNVTAHTPDAVTYQAYVEIVGLGRDGVLKGIKVEKWEALKVWQRIAKLAGHAQGVMFFVYNSSVREWAVLDFKAMTSLLKRSEAELGVQTFEVDKVAYFPVPWEWIVAKALWHAPYTGSAGASPSKGTGPGGV
jgi:hypothetical protein